MLSSSFLHISGIGPKTEQRIWGRGVRSWNDFLASPSAAGLPSRTTERVAEALRVSSERLADSDHRFFATALPRREHWRAYPEFSHRVAFLDIETTSLEGDDVTLIGLYDGSDFRVYQKGVDLDEFRGEIGRFGLIVTFFGTAFDLPFLRRRFPGLEFDQIHVDLCYGCRRLGLTGGLKRVERVVGLTRAPETEGLDGWDAVRLWREWEGGSQEALDLLKAYNREDVVNLAALMRHAYPRLRERSGFAA